MLLLLLALAACGRIEPGPSGAGDPYDVLLGSASTIDIVALDGRTVGGALTVTAHTTLKNIREVQYFLDDPGRVRAPFATSTRAPYGVPLDTTRVADGPHALVAVAVFTNRRTSVLAEANFTVRNAPARLQLGLRGNPAFDPGRLDSDTRRWYDRLWAALRHDQPASNAAWQAGGGNLYEYARPLNSTLTAMLVALRATGDLGILDEIDRLTSIMAEQLTTDWVDMSTREPVTPTDGTAGLRRWNYLRSGSHGGRDTHVMDTLLTHSVIAEVAYAFHANASNASPGGIDYARRAEFWRHYLVNDFEAIWTIRVPKASASKDYWQHQVSHSWASNIRLLYFLGRLTNEAAYGAEATRKANRQLDHLLDVTTNVGTAKVWSHRLFDFPYGLQPIVYARYDWMIMTSLALDGFAPYDDAFMRAHARTFTSFVLDNGTVDFSFDVGGMQGRTGTQPVTGTSRFIPTRNPWDDSSLTYARESAQRYALSNFAMLAAWDDSGAVRSTSDAVHTHVEGSGVDRPRRPFIAAGMLLANAARR